MSKILVIGSTGGVGGAVCNALQCYDVTAWNRNVWDLEAPSELEQLSLKYFDVVVICVGYNVGANRGFLNNSILNQNKQVMVNFTSQLLLIKEYLKSRETGHIVYFTSENIDDPISYNLFYTAAKKSLQYSADVLSKEFPNFAFTELRPGKIKSNMLRQNYGPEVSDDMIDLMYDSKPYLSCEYIAKVVVECIEKRPRLIKFNEGVAVFYG